jgi:(p)ppGpp synthase/HD superfamily hydrolase
MKPCDLFIIRTAANMAAEAHAGQTVRSSNTPFIAHPVRVAVTVMVAFGCPDDEVIAAALLHDTLEKTSLRSAQIGEELGPRVLDLVMAMTKRSSFDESIYWLRLERDVWQARLIKMADVLDHLDCPPDELPRRIENARKAVALGYSEEEPIVRARRILEGSLRSAEQRLEMT